MLAYPFPPTSLGSTVCSFHHLHGHPVQGGVQSQQSRQVTRREGVNRPGGGAYCVVNSSGSIFMTHSYCKGGGGGGGWSCDKVSVSLV